MYAFPTLAPKQQEGHLNADIGLVANNNGAGSLDPALALGHDIGLAGVGIVLTGARGILERRELIFTLDLKRSKLLEGQEGEDVKDELLELDAVGLLGLDGLAALEIGRGDLLAGDVVGKLMSPLGDGVEEAERVVVVDNVGSTESEEIRLLGVGLLGSGLVDLGVLNDIGLAVLGENQTDGLGSVALAHDLGSNVDIKGGREANEDRVGDLDEAVVNAVGVDVLDATLSHVVNNTRKNKSIVETAVSIRSNSNLALGLEENLAIVGDARQNTLLEDLDVLLAQAKVVVLLEELLGGTASRAASHDLLNLGDSLTLKLEERLVRGKTNVVAALGSRATQTSTLATSHKDNSDLTLGDEVKTGVVPLGNIIGAGVEDTGGGRFGKRLEAVGLIAGLGRVQCALCDVVDVGRVEARKLLVQSSSLGGG
ncbi:hypothetical protein HG531_001839 [Fusarium graminearum]|nr:hypothetical protein HG531_001839 [Fusarium graminearum]